MRAASTGCLAPVWWAWLIFLSLASPLDAQGAGPNAPVLAGASQASYSSGVGEAAAEHPRRLGHKKKKLRAVREELKEVRHEKKAALTEAENSAEATKQVQQAEQAEQDQVQAAKESAAEATERAQLAQDAEQQVAQAAQEKHMEMAQKAQQGKTHAEEAAERAEDAKVAEQKVAEAAQEEAAYWKMKAPRAEHDEQEQEQVQAAQAARSSAAIAKAQQSEHTEEKAAKVAQLGATEAARKAQKAKQSEQQEVQAAQEYASPAIEKAEHAVQAEQKVAAAAQKRANYAIQKEQQAQQAEQDDAQVVQERGTETQKEEHALAEVRQDDLKEVQEREGQAEEKETHVQRTAEKAHRADRDRLLDAMEKLQRLTFEQEALACSYRNIIIALTTCVVIAVIELSLVVTMAPRCWRFERICQKLDDSRQEVLHLEQTNNYLAQQADRLQQDVQSQRNMMMNQHEVAKELVSGAGGLLSRCPSLTTGASLNISSPPSSSDDESFWPNLADDHCGLTLLRPPPTLPSKNLSRSHPVLPSLPLSRSRVRMKRAYSAEALKQGAVDSCGGLQQALLSTRSWIKVDDEAWENEQVVEGVSFEHTERKATTTKVGERSDEEHGPDDVRFDDGSSIGSHGSSGKWWGGTRFLSREATPRVCLREERLGKKLSVERGGFGFDKCKTSTSLSARN